MRTHLIAIALAAPTITSADDAKTIGVDGGLALPTGTWGDGAGVGLGALARFEMPLVPKLDLTARAGVVYHMSKDGGANGGSAQATEVPFLGGVRYAFSDNRASSFYLAAEMGLVVSLVSVDFQGMSMSDSKTNFGMTLGAGYRAGKLDLRGGLFLPDLGHAGDAVGLMATVGYDVASL